VTNLGFDSFLDFYLLLYIAYMGHRRGDFYLMAYIAYMGHRRGDFYLMAYIAYMGHRRGDFYLLAYTASMGHRRGDFYREIVYIMIVPSYHAGHRILCFTWNHSMCHVGSIHPDMVITKYKMRFQFSQSGFFFFFFSGV
jgi:hypothetical protein